MKRRNFLQGVAASVGATAMPLPTLAKAATVGTTNVIPFHYGWACVYAQMNNGVSAADIARVFRISPNDATALMDRMFTRGVIHAPGLDGRSHPTRAWQPWDKRMAAPSANANTDRDDSPDTSTLDEKFRVMIAHVTDHPTFGWAS